MSSSLRCLHHEHKMTTRSWRLTCIVLLLALQTLLIVAGSPSKTNSRLLAHTKNGTYEGVHSPSFNQDFFLGVPYAQPPVNDLRLRQPQPLNTSFKATKPAKAYSPECIGYGSDDIGYAHSEDCLYLNVIRPSNISTSTPLPVAIWIHGGGYVEGGTVDARYNLSRIVANSAAIGRPMIGVSINYRLSFWGFGYSAEVQRAGVTNLGLRDQRLALHWVRENIGAFGGDASRVTIWGESAGAASVGFHLVAYDGRDDGLFRAGIMQSGNPIPYQNLNGTEFYQPLYDDIAHTTGCARARDSLACLRALPFDTLNAAVNTSANGAWFPVLDNDFLTTLPSKQLAQGRFVHVPIIVGANTDEGASDVSARDIDTTQDVEAFIASTAPNLPPQLIQRLLAAYPDDPCVGIPADLGCARPPAPYGAQYRRAAAFGGDYVFIAPRRLTCATWAAAGVPAYCYRFDARPYNFTRVDGVMHFAEVAFVFDNTDGEGYAVDPFEKRPKSFKELAGDMSRDWAAFVTDLEPRSWRSNGGVPMWPAYDVDEPKDFVWHAPGIEYVEADTYRAEGMKIINENAEAWLR